MGDVDGKWRFEIGCNRRKGDPLVISLRGTYQGSKQVRGSLVLNSCLIGQKERRKMEVDMQL